MKGRVRIALTVAALWLCAALSAAAASAPARTAPVFAAPAWAAPALPTAPAPSTIDLGVPGGDAYCIAGIAIDEPRGLAYVAHSEPAQPQHSSISIVDLRARQVRRVIPLRPPFTGPGNGLLVSPNGNYLYFYSHTAQANARLDTRTGAVVRSAVPAGGIHYSEDRAIVAVRGPDWLKVYRTRDFFAGKAPLWERSAPLLWTSRFKHLAVSGDRIALVRAAPSPNPAVLLLDLSTGRELAEAPVPRGVEQLLPAPDGGFAALLDSARGGYVARYDRDFKLLAKEASELHAGLTYDPQEGRYLRAGLLPDDATWGSQGYLVGLDATDLKARTRAQLAPGTHAHQLIPFADMVIGTVSDCEASRLDIYDRSTLQLRGRIPTGIRLVDMALDDAADRLYVADAHFRTYVIALPTGEAVAVWDGGAPLSLDARNRRLYVNTGTEVRALDTGSGEILARFPQYGRAAPDAPRNVVYIAHRGVTMYDLSGRFLGRLESTLPDPRQSIMSSQRYAIGATANPVTGHLAVLMYWRSYYNRRLAELWIYPPGVDRGTWRANGSRALLDLATDSAGNWYAAYGFPGSSNMIEKLTPDGQTRLARLGNSPGLLSLNEQDGRLYVALDTGPAELVQRAPEDRIAQLRMSDLSVEKLAFGAANVKDMVYSESRRALYLIDEFTPLVRVLPVDSLAPVETRGDNQ